MKKRMLKNGIAGLLSFGMLLECFVPAVAQESTTQSVSEIVTQMEQTQPEETQLNEELSTKESETTQVESSAQTEFSQQTDDETKIWPETTQSELSSEQLTITEQETVAQTTEEGIEASSATSETETEETSAQEEMTEQTEAEITEEETSKEETSEEETSEEETSEEETTEEAEGVEEVFYAEAVLNEESSIFSACKKDSSVVTTIPGGYRVYVTSVFLVEEEPKWAHIIFDVNEYCYEGYIPFEVLSIGYETDLMLTDQTSDFPADYQSALNELKKAHPNWTFRPIYVGDTFSYAVGQQMDVASRALVSTYYNECFRSMLDRDYDWQTNTWKAWEPGWAGASEETVRYYMDPRNFLNENDIFMFESLTYEKYQTQGAVEAALANTFMSNAKVPGAEYTYAWLFCWVGEKYNINPVALASRVRQEQGAGTSDLISGKYAGYEGLYNYFNIQATGSTRDQIVQNGLKEAKTGSTMMLPDGTVSSGSWDTPTKALIGGSLKFANLYILKNQNTLYAQKFDYDGQYNGKYWHQYMTNIMAPYSEGNQVRRSYANSGQLGNSFVFLIPVYEERPASSPKPQERKNQNNCLKSLSVNGQEVITKFDRNQRDFYYSVGEKTAYVNVAVKTASSSATLEFSNIGKMSHKVEVSAISVTAEDGTTAKYRLVVGRGIQIEDGFFNDFDVNSYRKRYPSLEKQYGDDIDAYYEHYLTIGKAAGWDGSKGNFSDDGNHETDSSAIYNGVDYTPVFNATYYLNRYPDLKAAFGSDSVAALKHFVENGIKEGRRASVEFDVTIYKDNYPDLQKAFGEDNTLYVNHYLNFGLNEGRRGDIQILNGIAVASDGKKYYYDNGKINTSYTGLASYQGLKYYVLAGSVQENRTGLILYENVWYYIRNGAVDTQYTGLALNGNWYYVKKGVVDWTFTGLVLHYGSWYYVEKGKLNWDYTGLALNGNWYYVKKGVVDWTFTGLVLYHGSWYYVEKGKLNWDYTGLALNGSWYYVKKGVVDWTFTGLVLYYGKWYYVEKGKLNWDYTGLALNGSWYYVKKGVVDWTFTGLVLHYGSWYYVEEGKLNWDYTGLALNGNWYYVKKGVVDWTFTGLVLYYETWYYVEEGKLNWNYNGLVEYNGTLYRVEKGVLNWNYSGRVWYNGRWYKVVKGVAQPS